MHHPLDIALFSTDQSYTMGSAPMAFIFDDAPTVTMTASDSQALFLGDRDAVVFLGEHGTQLHNVTLTLGFTSGITNIDYFNATDHISLVDSGFANPAAAASALKIGHFGETLALPHGGQINFNEPTALLTASRFTQV